MSGMATVWTVERCYPYEGCTLEGVFSSKVTAQTYIGSLDSSLRADCTITAWILDDPEAPTETDVDVVTSQVHQLGGGG